MKIKRKLQPIIESHFGQKKAIIIYGARQVGKTTLVQDLINNFHGITKYLNCDEPTISTNLSNKTSTELRDYMGQTDLVVIDEAQRVENIGLTIKLLVDNFPDLQVVATGSSSLDLANKISEPLTGRVFTYQLFPFSLSEILGVYSEEEIQRLLPRFMIYGTYPEIIASNKNPQELLPEIVRSYLLKDILSFQKIRNPQVLHKLLAALALQIGNEVATTELGNLVGIDKETVDRYIYLLEEAFIIKTISPFSRNLRSEINKKRKVYFVDLGIRNTLINNFNFPELRSDTGFLFENFAILEKIKSNSLKQISANYYFWRTYDQKEIDLIEEREGKLFGFEFKWGNKKAKSKKEFLKTYSNATLETITPNSLLKYSSPV